MDGMIRTTEGYVSKWTMVGFPVTLLVYVSRVVIVGYSEGDGKIIVP